jgi:hypothetical protein
VATTPSGSRRHKIQYLGHDDYRLSWTTYRSAGRMLHPTTYSRDTNRAGAERFAKKWRITLPAQDVHP